MEIYKAPIVVAVQNIHREEIFHKTWQFSSILAHLTAYATTLWEQIQQKSSVAYSQINNYHPDYLGVDIKQLEQVRFMLEDCQLTTAANFGYANWEAVEELGNQPYNIEFEAAVNFLINGELELLEQAIYRNPHLVNLQSQYGHKATLLHYTASNGIEMWRQQVPNNLPEIVKLLLQNGADKEAKMKVYGGSFTTLELLQTSAHPFEAGLGEQLITILT